jgi:hypothetical protein
MKEKVNIVCVYWEGDFRTRDFNPNDVWRLYASISKHIDRPFDFYVYTNKFTANLPGYRVKLLHADDWIGWWAKFEIFRAGIYPVRRTLYMDLDSHVIRSLAPLFEYRSPMVMFPGGTKNTPTKYQNSTMLFDPQDFRWVYTKFLKDDEYYISHYRGDQDILSEWILNASTFPREWMVKLNTMEKRFAKTPEPPEKAIIITGQPRSGIFRKTDTIPWLEKMARE